ncbi:MAG: cupredoxin domain-containing protein [Actinomycetota bacterium]
MKRWVVALGLGMGLIMVSGAGWAGATTGSSDGNTVRIVGRNTFIRNALIQSTLRFSPERLSVPSGSRVTWRVRSNVKEPHSVSLVRRRALPSNVNEVFGCQVCRRISRRHFSGDRPDKRLNAGEPGFDQPGDSRLLLRPGASPTARITAPAGTTLRYLCIIHPWMQGKIAVE